MPIDKYKTPNSSINFHGKHPRLPPKGNNLSTGRFLHRPHQHIADAPVACFVTAVHSGQGWIHGFNMKVTERLTRKGNTIRWEATVEDPDYFQQPWQVTPRTIYLNTDPKAFLAEALPCDQRVQEPWGTEDKPTGSHVH